MVPRKNTIINTHAQVWQLQIIRRTLGQSLKLTAKFVSDETGSPALEWR